MKQLSLLKPTRTRKPTSKAPGMNWFPKEQTEAARIILADPEKHGAGLSAWANLYLARKARDLPNDRH